MAPCFDVTCVVFDTVLVLQTCGKTITQIPDYIQIVGIILGMCTLGYLGDRIGRKWGSVFTASLMLIGAILLTATDAPTDRGFVIFYIISQVWHHHPCPAVFCLRKALACILQASASYHVLGVGQQPCLSYGLLSSSAIQKQRLQMSQHHHCCHVC